MNKRRLRRMKIREMYLLKKKIEKKQEISPKKLKEERKKLKKEGIEDALLESSKKFSEIDQEAEKLKGK